MSVSWFWPDWQATDPDDDPPEYDPDSEVERIAAASVHDWAAEAADRERYADVLAADLADQRRWDRS